MAVEIYTYFPLPRFHDIKPRGGTFISGRRWTTNRRRAGPVWRVLGDGSPLMERPDRFLTSTAKQVCCSARAGRMRETTRWYDYDEKKNEGDIVRWKRSKGRFRQAVLYHAAHSILSLCCTVCLPPSPWCFMVKLAIYFAFPTLLLDTYTRTPMYTTLSQAKMGFSFVIADLVNTKKVR